MLIYAKRSLLNAWCFSFSMAKVILCGGMQFGGKPVEGFPRFGGKAEVELYGLSESGSIVEFEEVGLSACYWLNLHLEDGLWILWSL